MFGSGLIKGSHFTATEIVAYILDRVYAEKSHSYARKLQRVLVGQLCFGCVDLQLVW